MPPIAGAAPEIFPARVILLSICHGLTLRIPRSKDIQIAGPARLKQPSWPEIEFNVRASGDIGWDLGTRSLTAAPG